MRLWKIWLASVVASRKNLQRELLRAPLAASWQMGGETGARVAAPNHIKQLLGRKSQKELPRGQQSTFINSLEHFRRYMHFFFRPKNDFFRKIVPQNSPGGIENFPSNGVWRKKLVFWEERSIRYIGGTCT
jgi:hypothetical protein